MNGLARIRAMTKGQPVDRLPFMPFTMQFAADFAGIRYRDYMLDPRSHAEGQIRTAEAFGCDHVSITSDPGVQPGDFGAAVRLFDEQPAAMDESRSLLAEKSALSALSPPDPLGAGRMHETIRLVRLYRERVGGEKAIEGWVEGPCALGADLRGINALMTDFLDDAAFVRDLFELCLAASIRFARAEMDAGADLIGIGDAAVSLVGPRVYRDQVWPYERRLVEALHGMGAIVRLHICGDIRRLLGDVGRLGCDIVDIDSKVPMSEARSRLGPEAVLLGNLDPVRVLRDGTPRSVAEAVARCHAEAGGRHIVSAGCEVPRDTPHANLHAMGDYARSHR